MRKLFQIAHTVFHILVLSFACLLLTVSFLPIRAQSRAPSTPLPSSQEGFQIDSLDRRLSVVEGLNLEHRLTVIETILRDMESNSLWFRISTGGTGLLLAEAVTRNVRKKKVE